MMKKSKAIEKLILWSKSNPDIVNKSLEEQWSDLLDFMVVKLGMLPPETYYIRDDGHEDDDPFISSSPLRAINDWDEE